MSDVPDKNAFASLYSGQAPWDIGKPQKPFIDMADQITGSILDAGCGTGDNALYFASRGHNVTGIDFLEEPIKRATRKASERGLTVNFFVKDALTLNDWAERFDNVIDCGLFHVFSDEDRKKYVAGQATVLKPGGRLFLLCFSDQETGTQGPRRITHKELLATFAEGWAIESIQPSRFEVIPNLKEFSFSEGGPKAWFVVVQRTTKTTQPPTLKNPTEGQSIAVVGDVYRFLALGEDTNDKYAMWEAIVPPGGGPPPHVHSREEEGFYILEGEITLTVGNKRIVVTAGMFANMPVGTPHSFKNESSKSAKMLISVAPSGLEKMFFEVGVPVAQGATTAPPPTKEEIEKLLAVAPKYGIEIMLPKH